jgi:sugar O-acyltransferase (sialic acid O-acetyltransferase NeuD family)
MSHEKIILVGMGGHAKVVYDALCFLKKNQQVEARDHNVALQGQIFFGKPILGVTDEELVNIPGNIHASMGDNRHRKRIYELLYQASKPLYSIVHPLALVSSFATLGQGVFVAATALIAANSKIGDGVIVNHKSIVDHDCHIEAMVHIAPNVTLSGGVHIGEGSLIGAGAIILPNVKIGKWAVVGAGAVVTKNVLPNDVVVGVPAISKKVFAT